LNSEVKFYDSAPILFVFVSTNPVRLGSNMLAAQFL